MYVTQFQSDSSVLESESKEGVAKMLGHVTKVLDHLTSQSVQHLFLIKGSQMYVMLIRQLTFNWYENQSSLSKSLSHIPYFLDCFAHNSRLETNSSHVNYLRKYGIHVYWAFSQPVRMANSLVNAG